MEEEADYKCRFCAFAEPCTRLPCTARVPADELF